MNKKTTGFNLIEIMIVIIITGVIFSLSSSAIKAARASYTSLTYFAHRNVLAMVKYLKNNNINFISDSDAVFCNNLYNVSNTIGAKNCNFYAATSSAGYDPSFVTGNNTGAINISNPNFTLANGMRVYISSARQDTSNVSSLSYRLIGFDLNGTKGPNSVNSRKANSPTDIVVFMILSNGEVYPLGVAADNMALTNKTVQYLNANNIYYNGITKTTVGTATNYRTAFCSAYRGKGTGYINYANYCTHNSTSTNTAIAINSGCSSYLCSVTTVKPMFRYSFK